MDKRLTGTLHYILGIYAIIQALSLVPGPLSLIAYPNSMTAVASTPLYLLATIGPAALLFLGGIYLMFRNDKTALAGSPALATSSTGMPTAGIHSSVLSGVGLLLIGLALSDLPDVLSKVWAAYAVEREGASFAMGNKKAAWIGCIGPMLQLLLGLFLFWKSSALVTWLRRRHDRTSVTAADAQCPNCGYWVVSKDYNAAASAFRCDNCKQEIPKGVVRNAAG